MSPLRRKPKPPRPAEAPWVIAWWPGTLNRPIGGPGSWTLQDRADFDAGADSRDPKRWLPGRLAGRDARPELLAEWAQDVLGQRVGLETMWQNWTDDDGKHVEPVYFVYPAATAPLGSVFPPERDLRSLL